MSASFSRLVSEGMAERGLGLRELCRRAGLDPSLLSKVLAGKRNPPTDERALRKLAGALELEPLALVVAAGVIPAEWGDLSSDPELLRRLSAMLGGSRVPAPRPAAVVPAPSKPAPVAPSQGKWQSRPVSTPLVRKPFSEELL